MAINSSLNANDFRVKGELEVLYITLIVVGIILVFLVGVSLGAVLIVILLMAGWIKLQQSQLIGRSVKVSELQLPEVYNAAKAAAQRLSINMPDVFVQYDPTLNAYAIGFFAKKSVVLHSAMVETMTQEELISVIGHEFSHVKCEHVRWLVLTNTASSFRIPIITDIVHYIFLFWSRKAEYTSDRGGLIACGNLKASVSSLAKLAIGKELFNKLNLQQLIDQKKDIDDDLLARFGQLEMTHPYLINRIHALKDFYQSDTYRRLNTGVGYMLALQGKTIYLTDGSKLAITSGITGEVNHNPQDPGMLGLKNLSSQTWNATMPDGSTHVIGPGKSIRLAHLIKINFGAVTGEIQ